MLINKSLMEFMTLNYTDLNCSSGTITHLSDPLYVTANSRPSYLPFAMLYGIKGWTGDNFDLPQLGNLFENLEPKVDVRIGYILFQTSSCPADQLYVAS